MAHAKTTIMDKLLDYMFYASIYGRLLIKQTLVKM